MIWSTKDVFTVAVVILGLSVCLLFHTVECKSSLQREICSEYNYCGTTDGCENGTLNYARAIGPNDVLHYAWSTVGYPTVIISRSSLDVINVNNCVSNFHVHNYTEFQSNQTAGSVSIDDVSTNFSFALIFKSLIEFKVSTRKLPATSAFHPDQLQDCCDQKNCYLYHLNNDNLTWTTYDVNVSRGMKAKDAHSDFTVTLKVNPRHDGGYEHGYAPKPWYTANSTTFDFLMKNFVYRLSNLEDPKSRLALEVDLVQGPALSNCGKLGQKYSKNDEYTPSIFYTNFFSFGGEQDHGYIRWKPITYITHHRKSSESQQANAVLGNATIAAEQGELPGGLARAIFGSNYSCATTIYLVFGTEKDDSALNSGMYSWTGSIGYGDQPDEPFSTLIILIIAIGLGIPAALTVLAIGFVITLNVYRWHKSRRGYRRI